MNVTSTASPSAGKPVAVCTVGVGEMVDSALVVASGSAAIIAAGGVAPDPSSASLAVTPAFDVGELVVIDG